MRNVKNTYQTTEILTADPGKLVLLLYDGAISFLRQGQEKLQENDYETKGYFLMKAHDIVSELLSCLHEEKGGEIALRLKSIYTYILKRIMDGDLNKETRAIDESIQLLSELREAWQKIIVKNHNEVSTSKHPDRTEITATI